LISLLSAPLLLALAAVEVEALVPVELVALERLEAVLLAARLVVLPTLPLWLLLGCAVVPAEAAPPAPLACNCTKNA